MGETTSRDVRLARQGDARELGQMSRQLIEHGLAWRWRPGRIRHAILAPDTTVIVTDAGDRTAGFALVSFAETTAHLSLLAVSPQYQRQGIAGGMLDWIVASCRVAGIARLSLEVRSANNTAISLYRRYGFERTGLRRGYYDGREDALSMQLHLIDPITETHRPK